MLLCHFKAADPFVIRFSPHTIHATTEAVIHSVGCLLTSIFVYSCYVSVLDPAGHCIANEQYIGQLKETFATSVPQQIAAFFGEPIQVQYSVFLGEGGCNFSAFHIEY